MEEQRHFLDNLQILACILGDPVSFCSRISKEVVRTQAKGVIYCAVVLDAVDSIARFAGVIESITWHGMEFDLLHE